MEFLLNIRLMDAASILALVCTMILIIKVSARTSKSIFRIIFGYEKRLLIESSTVSEKIIFSIVFVLFFIMGSLWIHGVLTLGDLFAKLLPG